jgi:hypothetical protein
MATIYDFLLLQSQLHLSELYQNEWCALAVFQSLDTLSRTLLMRLVFLNGVFSNQLLEQFVQPTPQHWGAVRAAVDRLKNLRIFGTPTSASGAAVMGYDMNGPREGADVEPLAMNAYFQASLQRAILASSSAPWELETSVLPPLRRVPTAVDIEQHASRQWNAILHFLVGTADAPLPSPKVRLVVMLIGVSRLRSPCPAAPCSRGEGRLPRPKPPCLFRLSSFSSRRSSSRLAPLKAPLKSKLQGRRVHRHQH